MIQKKMIFDKIDYRKCWITVNRDCNVACTWCYAKNVDKNELTQMPFASAKKIVDICKDLNISSIVLIGGEPTLYKNLIELIKYCSSLNIRTTLITNGIRLSDKDYFETLKQAGLTGVSLSLKGNDRENYIKIAGRDCFDLVMSAINNIGSFSHSISMVITKENISSFIEGVRAAKNAGAKFFSFSYCYNFNVCGISNHDKEDIRLLIDGFVDCYDELDAVTEGRFTFSQSLPLCLWDAKFISKLNKKGQLSSVCQLLKRAGLIFDTDSNLIPCNAMHQLKLGKLDYDFSTGKELKEYLASKSVNDIYDKLCSVPDNKCINCVKYENCGGGCVTQWTNYSFKEIENL